MEMPPVPPRDWSDPNAASQYQSQYAQWMDRQNQAQHEQLMRNIEMQKLRNMRSRPVYVYRGPGPLMTKLASEHPLIYLLCRILQIVFVIVLMYLMFYFIFSSDMLARMGWEGAFSWLNGTFLDNIKTSFWNGLENLQNSAIYQ